MHSVDFVRSLALLVACCGIALSCAGPAILLVNHLHGRHAGTARAGVGVASVGLAMILLAAVLWLTTAAHT